MIKIKTAIKVLKKLKDNGYQSYIVGGAVRDYLLKAKPHDIDITTIATPEEVSQIFKTYPSGLKFGSVTVKFEKETFEVTTFREDFDYLDSRRPSKIKYAKDPKVDALRRDFTINALMLDENMKLFDFVFGQKDLKDQLIRAVGNPEDRFKEDALRILRAFYFQSKLGFDIEDKTLEAINKCAFNIKNIARERVLQELIKMSKGKFLKKAVTTFYNSNVIKELAEFKEYFDFMVKQNKYFYDYDFLLMAYIFNKNIENVYILPNKILKDFIEYKNLLTKQTKIDKYLIYKIGLEKVLKYNFILNALNDMNKQSNESLIELDKKMKVKTRKDVKISNQKIIKILNKKAGPWVKSVETKIVKSILEGKLKNETEDIVKYIEEEIT